MIQGKGDRMRCAAAVGLLMGVFVCFESLESAQDGPEVEDVGLVQCKASTNCTSADQCDIGDDADAEAWACYARKEKRLDCWEALEQVPGGALTLSQDATIRKWYGTIIGSKC